MTAPLILALDSSGGPVTAAVLGDTLLAERSRNVGLTHSETLMPMIEGVLADAGCRLEQLTALAVAAGPGSFTGLRIGLSTAKALAMAAEKPLIPVSTLAALALQGQWFPGIVAPVMDARRGQVYAGAFECGSDLREVLPCQALAAGELVALLRPMNRPVLLLGDGVQPNMAAWQGLQAQFAPVYAARQRAACVAALAQRMWESAKDPMFDPLTVDAVYLRASQAEQTARKGSNP